MYITYYNPYLLSFILSGIFDLFYLVSGTFYLLSNIFYTSPFAFYFFSLLFFIQPITVDDWTFKRKKIQNFHWRNKPLYI